MKRLLPLLLLLGSVTATAHGADAGGEKGFLYEFILFLHQVLFVFWLGPDIGVYMWSTKAVNSELSQAQRVAAGRIMRAIDIIPQVCMSLMLTVGGTLTELMGLEHPWWQMAGIWLLGPVWLTLTLLVYFRSGGDSAGQLAKLDRLFRLAVVASVVVSVIYSVTTGRLDETPWVTAKLLIFAAVVLFGLVMRLRIAPFMAALDKLEADGPSPELDQTMAHSISRARLFMVAIWIGLAIAAWLGMAQPG